MQVKAKREREGRERAGGVRERDTHTHTHTDIVELVKPCKLLVVEHVPTSGSATTRTMVSLEKGWR